MGVCADPSTKRESQSGIWGSTLRQMTYQRAIIVPVTARLVASLESRSTIGARTVLSPIAEMMYVTREPHAIGTMVRKYETMLSEIVSLP